MIVEEIEERRKRHSRGRWKDTFRKSKINPKVRKAVSMLSQLSGGKLNFDPNQNSDLDYSDASVSPKVSPRGSPKVQRKKSDKNISIIAEECSSDLERENAQNILMEIGEEDDGTLTTMEKAVKVVVHARRLRSRVSSVVVPMDGGLRIKEPVINIRQHSPSPMPHGTSSHH